MNAYSQEEAEAQFRYLWEFEDNKLPPHNDDELLDTMIKRNIAV